jgi:hypothetical protein
MASEEKAPKEKSKCTEANEGSGLGLNRQTFQLSLIKIKFYLGSLYQAVIHRSFIIARFNWGRMNVNHAAHWPKGLRR